jgi:glycosyltransferase involved in cell wall biosynthesis
MATEPLQVVLIAGRIETANDDAVRFLAERLSSSGLCVRVVGLAGGRDWRSYVPLVRAPALARAWSRPWAVRHAGFLTGCHLIHAIGIETAEVALALAEHHRLPYLLSIVEFPVPGSSLRISRRWCRRAIATGHDLAEDLVMQLGIPETWLEVIPAGVVPQADEHQPLPPGRVPVIGAAGSLDPGAGLATFLAAARELLVTGIDAEFIVAGQMRDECEVRRLASHLGIAERVTYVEDSVETRRYWRVLDVYCQSSLVPSSGRELAEALAQGIPAIASDVPGLRAWIVTEETGLLFAPGDIEGLAAAIHALLVDPARAGRLGNRARDWVSSHCDPAREVESLTRLYRDAVEQTVGLTPSRDVRKHAALR